MAAPTIHSKGQIACEHKPQDEDFLTLVINTAIESAIRAFILTIFGTIAIGIAGSIWEEMMPSNPPGFGSRPQGAARHTLNWGFGDWFRAHQFAIVFAIVFIPSVWTRLRRGQSSQIGSERPSRLSRIGERLSQDWFDLVVGNAFGAMIGAVVVTFAQQFAIEKILVQQLIAWLLSHLQTAMTDLLGATTGTVESWWNWYTQNQLKFCFWFLYLAAITDDLGIPNIKTLARYLARRWRKWPSRRDEAGEPS